MIIKSQSIYLNLIKNHMKKYLLCLLLLAFITPFSAKAEDIVIGTGTSGSVYCPFYNFTRYSWTESVYPASNFDTEYNINSIAFYCSAASPLSFYTLDIYMGVRDDDSYSSGTDWTPQADLTLVYSGTNVTVGSEVGWQTFVLDNPYVYESDNLVIAVSKTCATSTMSQKWASTSASSACLYIGSSSGNSYANYPIGKTATISSSLPNIKLNVTPATISCKKP